MTTGAYVTAAGLSIPVVTQLQSEMGDDIRANSGLPLLDTAPESPLGQLIGIFAERLRSPWEIVQIAYNSSPGSAEGRQLEGIAEFSGTYRAAATRSRFAGEHGVELDLEANKTVSVGSRFTTTSGSPIFEVTAEVVSTTAGIYLAEMSCTELGPITCNAGTLTVAITNVVGLNSVTNPFAATPGTNEDTDAQLRVRRENELYAGGASTVDAIRSDILAYRDASGGAPILEAAVFENVSESFADGLPPKSFEALVFDGIGEDVADDVIAAIIWKNKPAGIQSVGNASGTVVDGNGEIQIVKFSRPTVVDLKIEIDVLVNPVTFAGAAAVQAAIVARLDERRTLGGTIYAEDARGAAQILVPGVVNVTRLQIGPLAGTLLSNGQNYTLTRRQVALLDAANVTVTVTEVT